MTWYSDFNADPLVGNDAWPELEQAIEDAIDVYECEQRLADESDKVIPFDRSRYEQEPPPTQEPTQ